MEEDGTLVITCARGRLENGMALFMFLVLGPKTQPGTEQCSGGIFLIETITQEAS